ncbi:hypothetical protein LCGC14_1220000 [marine sediment metagenome]|uniref:Uncharacterized protein n=1 Tax=marine sediment metagenome TaxID=412755 RepID=A0A0F9PG66_9ZZZZ
MKTTTVDLQQAYKDKVERIHHPNRYRMQQLYKKRKENGFCIMCGRKKMTKSQKARGLVTCAPCRKKTDDGKRS